MSIQPSSGMEKSSINNTNKKNENATIIEKKVKKTESTGLDNSAILTQYSTGRRKNASARVWVRVGKGTITVNKKPLLKYFPIEAHQVTILKPFEVTGTLGEYDIICTVKGGGCSGQAGAIAHGVSRSLDKLVPDFHKILRDQGLLTRDSRVVERKKYGKSGARKSYQFSKR